MSFEGPLRTPTFGVELEFVIRHPPIINGFRELYKPCIRQQLRNHLKEGGIKVNMYHTLYSAWTVDDDSSIRPYEDEDDMHNGLEHTSVELISRILPVSQEGFHEIRRVIDLVRGKFDVKVNKSTGLHVHVGNGSEGFNDRCIQNLAQLVTVFEYQIDSIHPDWRIDCNWAMAPSSNPALSLSNPFQAAEALQEDEGQAVYLMNGNWGRNAAYNFTNLVDPAGLKKTIEFRQHTGSMDVQQVLAWAEFVTGLVSYCHLIPPERYTQLILRFGTDKGFNVLMLMQIIGKPHLIDYYRDKLVTRKRRKIPVEKSSKVCAMS